MNKEFESDAEKLKSLYSGLLNDVDFDKLELGLKTPNVFNILKITRNEIRHSNFLSWLLDPGGSHGLGDLILKRFLREVFSSERFTDVDQVDVEGLDLWNVNILREWNHIDLLIVLSDVVICVENKVFSKEHSKQLQRYKEVIDQAYPNSKKVFVYLNPEGEETIDETDVYQPISYRFIVETLERIVEVYGESIKPQVLTYIKDYINAINRDIMGSDKLTDLARKIYSNHKELLDFILESRPDLTLEVRDLLSQILKDRGFNLGSENKFYVRFLSPEVDPLIYRNKVVKNGWNQGESFLHEIVIGVNVNKITYKPVLSPSDENYNSEGLLNLLLEIDGARKPYGKKWRVPLMKIEKFDFDSFVALTMEERREKLELVVDKFIPLISKVDDKILQNKELLSYWCNK